MNILIFRFYVYIINIGGYFDINIGRYFDKNIDKVKINKNTLKFIEILY